MADMLMSFERPVVHASGSYHARAVGRLAEDGMWEGWLEFEPLAGHAPTVVGGVESRQPEAHHLAYWATGLTPVFLEGALERALERALRAPTVVARAMETPSSEAPTPRRVALRAVLPTAEAVLDPFAIAARNPDILRQELHALNRPRLLNIIAAYHLNPAATPIDWMTDAQLVAFIVTATEAQLTQGAR